MSKYTAEQARSSLQKMHGHPLTVAERAELFSMASNYADLLRERESAKAGVTDEIVYRACKAGRITRDEPPEHELAAMRRKLEAVAPMLATPRSLTEALGVLEHWAMRGNILNGDDVNRFLAIADRIAPRSGGIPKTEKE